MIRSRAPAARPGRVRAALRGFVLGAAACAASFLAPPPVCAGDEHSGAPLPVREVTDAVRAAIPAPDLIAWLGVVVEGSPAGVRVVRSVRGSPAEQAGLRAGDYLRTVGNAVLSTTDDLDRALGQFRPGDGVSVELRRGTASALTLNARLAARRPPDGLFRGAAFRLAVVPIRFADDVADPIAPAPARRMLFSMTGRDGAGASLADYFLAQSRARLRVDGAVLDPVVLPRTRSAYAGLQMGGEAGSAFQEAADLLRVRAFRAGGVALEDFDGVAFLYGGAPETRAGFALWPHRATVSSGTRRLPYYVQGTGGDDGRSIGIHCHEFGHLLGLADAYGAGHRTGSGDFCLMAIGHRGGPQSGESLPFSLCAHCKLRLGWLDAPVLDPRVAQRVRLRPVQTAADQGVVVALDARCDEYLLLENRARRGFDAELPSDGLLVWHVGGAPTRGQSVYSQPVDLVEAHGIDTFEASLVRTDEIAFPTGRCRDLTPETRPGIVPASRAGFPAYLTDIVREADGSVVLTLGVPRRVRQAAPQPWRTDVPDASGWVVRKDPITGEAARFYVGPREGAPADAAPIPPAVSSGQERR